MFQLPKKIIVAFYGASVTQQGVNQRGEITGYVQRVKENLRSKLGDVIFEFHQFGFGSNHFNDAGFIYFSELLQVNPNIVVMDWHSTWLSEFNGDLYAHAIDTLVSAGIRVINCVFPKKSCIGQMERINIKQARWYERRGVPLINLYSEIGRRVDPEICLRDDVHTTPFGAQVYGLIVSEVIIDILQGREIVPSQGEVIVPPEKYRVPVVGRYAANLDIGKGGFLDIYLRGYTDWPDVSLLGRCLVGPFAPILDIETCNCKWQMSIWDRWCHFNRVCLKRITPPVKINNSDMFRVCISISDTPPDYTEAVMAETVFHDVERVLKIRGYIYIIAGEILDIKAIP